MGGHVYKRKTLFKKYKQIWKALTAAKILFQLHANISIVFLMIINLCFYFQKGGVFHKEIIVQLIISY